MTTPANANQPVVFKPRTGKWFAGATWVLVGIGLVFAVVTGGFEGLQTALPLLTLAYLAWWLFWYPSVCVDQSGVTLINPVRSVSVPWASLIHVDTKYSLTLITPTGRYGSWAAPAPGIWGTHRGRPEHVQGLPGTTYGHGQSIRPGDLKNTDSGAAAYLVRSRWNELVEADQLDHTAAASAEVRFHWIHTLCAAALIGVSLLGFALS
ncbi:PH domain-containing protein [Arthrobacter sp. H5]|uniref:PH domain-containing protein n=1 Tax=Arthrobacter sp. H5 TaxID=1267973 RepID=UPI0004839CBA|nr:PH domain-containing protein [Arthrobacter sp. H5]